MAVHDARGSILSVAAGAILIIGMSGCSSASETPSPAPSGASSSPGATQSTSPDDDQEAEEADALPFVAPTTCSELVGAELETWLVSEGRVFLFGSNATGLYAGEYFGSSQEVGTPLSCVFGKDNSDVFIEFDVQGLAPDTYQAALTALTAHEFTESTDGEVRTFALVGARGIQNTQVHVLRPDSWITIVNLRGGTSAFDETNGWLDTVTAQVYPES